MTPAGRKLLRAAPLSPRAVAHAWMALAVAGVMLACDDNSGSSSSTPTAPPEPSLTVSVLGSCINMLPVPQTPQQLMSSDFERGTVLVTGADPETDSGQFADGQAVTVAIAEAVGSEDAGSGLFGSNLAPGQAESKGLVFAGGRTDDEFVCVSEGVARVTAYVEGYPAGTSDRLTASQPFAVICLRYDDWQCECNRRCGPDAAPPDVADEPPPPEDASGDVVTVDVGSPERDASDAGPDVPDDAAPLEQWTLNYDSPPQDQLIINIRGAFRDGRGDSIGLAFRVAQLDIPVPNASVEFSLGSNAPVNVLVEPAITMTDAAGMAYVRVIAGGSPGIVSVHAEATIDERTQATNSPPITVLGGIPSQRGFDFACENTVIQAFTSRANDDWGLVMKPGTNCTVQLSDRLGGRVGAGVRVFFTSEAGNVTQAQATGAEGAATTQHRIGDPPPVDVAPEQFEPTYWGSHNPRDGVVTLIAFTKGEEAFIDLNGNKYFEEGVDDFPIEFDLVEPFVDANDNGLWDPGEFFDDQNRDGQWTEANGVWDNSVNLWKAVNVLWVGDFVVEPGQFSVVNSEVFEDFSYSFEDIGSQSAAVFSCQNAGCTVDNTILDCPDGRRVYVPDQQGIDLAVRFADANGNCPTYDEQAKVTVTTNNLKVYPEAFRAGVLGSCGNTNRQGAFSGAPVYFIRVVDESPLPEDGVADPTPDRILVQLSYELSWGRPDTVSWGLSTCVE